MPRKPISIRPLEELLGCTRIEDGATYVTGVLVEKGIVTSTPAGLEWMRGKPLMNVLPLATRRGWTVWRTSPRFTAERALPNTEPASTAATGPPSGAGGLGSSGTSPSSTPSPARSTSA